MRLKSL
jgi:hypothetical protein